MSRIPPKIAPKPGKVRVVRALYNYSAQHADELSFSEGDVLYVYDQVTDPNWWKARCGDKSGLIPSNYVENSTEDVLFPLHDAAKRGNLSYLKECLQHGVSPSALDHASNTPLFWAARAGHLECVQELLKIQNAVLNAQNRLGDTALHAAAAHGHVEIIQLLLEQGADTMLRNSDKLCAMDVATGAVRSVIQTHQYPNGNLRVSYTPEDYDDSD